MNELEELKYEQLKKIVQSLERINEKIIDSELNRGVGNGPVVFMLCLIQFTILFLIFHK